VYAYNTELEACSKRFVFNVTTVETITSLQFLSEFSCRGGETGCRSTVYYQRHHHHLIFKAHYSYFSFVRIRKSCYRKDDRSMRPIHGCPEKFRDSMATRPRILFRNC